MEFYERCWKDVGPQPTYLAGDRLAVILQVLAKLDVRRILDAGCGNGWFTAHLKKAGFDVVGLDVSGTAIKVARQAYPDIEFVCAPLDRERWPFGDASFDVILATEVIEHIYDTEVMFAEMARCCRPGGYALLTTPYHALLKNLVIALVCFDRHFDVRGPHVRFYSRKSLTRVLRDYGFEPRLWRWIGRVRPIAKSVLVLAQRRRGC
jgi:SAM-dependent methyltransferase